MTKRDWALTLGLALMVGVGSWLLMPGGGDDWHNFFGPAGRHWHPAPWRYVPYMPWAAVAFAPLAALSDQLATALVNAAGVVALVGVLRRYGGPTGLAVPLVFFPPTLKHFMAGQLDLLFLAGLLLPAGFDLLALVTKPQVAAGALVARLARRDWRQRVAYFAPLIVVGLAALVIWPGWPAAFVQAGRAHVNTDWNVAPWPWLIPVGLALLVRAWRRQDEAAGLLATPCLMPFVNMNTLAAYVVIVAARWPKWFWVVWLIAWAASVRFVLPYFSPAASVPYLVGLALGGLTAVGAELVQRWRSELQSDLLRETPERSSPL